MTAGHGPEPRDGRPLVVLCLPADADSARLARLVGSAVATDEHVSQRLRAAIAVAFAETVDPAGRRWIRLTISRAVGTFTVRLSAPGAESALLASALRELAGATDERAAEDETTIRFSVRFG
jgi:hypothetical protein